MNEILNKCSDLPEASFADGEIVMEEGKKGGGLYILAEGSVEILKQDFQINTVDSTGSLFGEVSVLLDLPHMATVKTLEPSRFYVAHNPGEFLKSHPEVHLHLSRLLAKRLNSVTSYLVDLKQQFEDREDHLGMVDDVLESLLHNQPDASSATAKD